MSQLLQVEQTTPTTPGASQQLIYPKVGKYVTLDSSGVERELVAGQGSPSGSLMQLMAIQYGAL